jgi:hypothetical protein
VVRVSSVGTATRYGLKGPGIESPSKRGFPHRSRLAFGPTQPPLPGPSRGKAAGAWCWEPTTSGAEVKESVELYTYSPLGPSWPILRRTLPLPLRLFLWLRNLSLIVHFLSWQNVIDFLESDRSWTRKCRISKGHVGEPHSLPSRNACRLSFIGGIRKNGPQNSTCVIPQLWSEWSLKFLLFPSVTLRQAGPHFFV